MEKRVIVLAFSVLLILGFVSTVEAFSFSDFWDKLTNPSITGYASKKTTDSVNSGSSNGGGSKSQRKTSDSDVRGESKKVTSTQEIYTFLDENQERVEIQIKTETKTKGGENYTKIKVRNVEATSNLGLEKEFRDKIQAKLSNGKDNAIKIMPNTASKIALSKLRSQNRTLELKEVGEGNNLSVVYYSEANKTVKFLGLFKMRYKLSAIIDGETGEIISFEGKPWWSFLTGEPLEEGEIEDLTLQLIKPLEDILITKNGKEIIDLDDYFFNAESYSLSELDNFTLELDDSLLTIIPEINWTGTTSFSLTASRGNDSLDSLFNVIVSEENASIQTTQYGAVVGEKVRWKKEVKVNKKGKIKINLPKNSENISLVKLDENGEVLSEESVFGNYVEIRADKAVNYEIAYLTLEPEMFERILSENNKEIIITGADDVHYTDIIAFNYLEKEVMEENIKLYHLTKNGKTEVELDKYDLNENGLIDYIEWIVPHLSNQTYELELIDFATGNFSFVSPENNSIHNSDYIYINLTSVENLNLSLLNWGNSSGVANVTMNNDSMTHWFVNMTSLIDGAYNFSAWAQNVSGSWVESDRIFLSIDTIFPEINLIYPTNTSYSSNVSALNYTFTETNSDKCWYSLDNGATNSSTQTCGTNWTGLSSSEGSNNWTVYINDTAGNENSSSVTFSKDTVYPLIDYGTGTAGVGDVVSQDFIYVNVSVTETNEDTITFLLYDSGGQVDSTSYTDGTRTINWTGLSNGVYTYNVTVNDTLGNSNTTSTRNITLDTGAPVISFSCDLSSVYIGDVITCSCSATSATDPSPTVSYTQSPSTSSIGDFTTTCTALDSSGVSASSTIGYSVARRARSGYPNYRVSSEDLSKGYNKAMKKNWKLNFKIENETHTFLVNNVSENGVLITLSSTPQEASLKVGEEKKFDLTEDDYYDLSVKLDSIAGDYASFRVQSIYEEIVVDTDTSEIIEQEDSEEDSNWLGLLIGIIIVGLIVFHWTRKK